LERAARILALTFANNTRNTAALYVGKGAL
jgi:hypothetical protein